MNPFDEFESIVSQNLINIHAYMVMKDGNLVAKQEFEPFRTDSLHRMFSVAKSFTSLAIGKLWEEGIINLSDPIIDHFPEYVTDDTHEWLRELTIKEMLMMATCYSKTTYNREKDKNWSKSFFYTTPDHRPGTVFAYDTSSAQVLCELVERKTGKDLLAYMRESFLDEIGFSKEAYMIKDPSGVSCGGSGLMCTLEDLMKVSVLLMDGGKHNGKQLISNEYIKEATKMQIATDPCGFIDERNGYGYMFWRTRKPGFCMYGMGGQLALIYPEHKLIFVCIADTQAVQGGLTPLYEAFYSTIYKWATVNKWKPRRLDVNDSNYKKGTVRGYEYTDYSKRLNYKMAKFCKNVMDIDNVRFDFTDRKLYFKTYESEYVIPYGYNSYEKFIFPGSDENAVASAAWVSDSQLVVRIQIMDEDLSPVIMEFGFNDNNAVTLRMKATNEPFILKKFAGIAGGSIEE